MCCSVLQCVAVCCSVLQCVAVCCSRLTEEIRLEICGSPDWQVFLSTLLSNGDTRLLPWKLVWNFRNSRENLFESYRDSRENLLKFCQSFLKSELLHVWFSIKLTCEIFFSCTTVTVHKNFSKPSSVVILYVTFSRKLTCEKFYLWHAPRAQCHVWNFSEIGSIVSVVYMMNLAARWLFRTLSVVCTTSLVSSLQNSQELAL